MDEVMAGKKKVFCNAPTLKGGQCQASLYHCNLEPHLRYHAAKGEEHAIRRFNDLAPLMKWKTLESC